MERLDFGSRVAAIPDSAVAHELIKICERRYAVPFNDEQISQFARNWFMERDAVRDRAYQDATSLVQAIKTNRNTQRLARTPNLLTMMALIFRIRARLPNGRALLYSDIVQAYLQSIDEYRKLQELDYSLDQKRRWLARVGFEMQRHRSIAAQEQTEPDETSSRQSLDQTEREILASSADVSRWIAEAMSESAFGADEQLAAQFVDYIGRRSGLLLPRGQDQFAFMHLSFQEYFAATYLLEEINAARTARVEPVSGATDDDLRRYAADVTWRETMIFLFELGASQKFWSKSIAQTIWGTQFESLMTPEWSEKSEASAVLLAVLAADPHSGFDSETRRLAAQAASSWQLEFDRYSNSTFRHLMAAESLESRDLWDGIRLAVNAHPEPHLDLSNTDVNDLESLAGLTQLQWLSLNQTSVSDLRPLASLTQLQVLYLNQTSCRTFARWPA